MSADDEGTSDEDNLCDTPTKSAHEMLFESDIVELIKGIIVEEELKADILAIAKKMLKQATQIKMQATLKTIMILTVVVSYENLHQSWSKPGLHHHKRPKIAASQAVSTQMGKGPPFACKICEMVPYILKYQTPGACKAKEDQCWKFTG